MAKYKGPVVFVDGVHYPATDDDEGADLSRPLRWDDGAYRDASNDDPLHNDTYPGTELELPVGGE